MVRGCYTDHFHFDRSLSGVSCPRLLSAKNYYLRQLYPLSFFLCSWLTARFRVRRRPRRDISPQFWPDLSRQWNPKAVESPASISPAYNAMKDVWTHRFKVPVLMLIRRCSENNAVSTSRADSNLKSLAGDFTSRPLLDTSHLFYSCTTRFASGLEPI